MHDKVLEQQINNLKVDYSKPTPREVVIIYRLKDLVEVMEKLLDKHKIVYNNSKEEAMKLYAKGKEVVKI